MTKRLLTTATFAALAIGLTTFTGSAIAGNGNGATPPGQEKKADQAAPAAQPAAQPAAASPSTPPGQTKKAASAGTTQSPGQAKQAAKASASTPGVKPSNSTAHWTHCSTGGTPTAATCTGNGSKADGSKQYGNGKTAAQIAVSRGAPVGTVLTGPGNSQPHKVTVCGKPNNKSGGVDVHAVKSYSTASCTPLQAPAQQAPAAATPATAVPAIAPAPAATPAAAPAATGTPIAATPTAGGVLGAQATLVRPAKKPAGGVLGATTRLGRAAVSGTLPFTGLPLWIVTLVALALIAGGLAFRAGRPARQL
jgi:hypothetical protein